MTRPPRAVFFGSGGFGVPVLEALAEAPDVRLCAVISAPAHAAGRSGRVRPTPVAVRAAELGLPVLVPDTLRDQAALDAIRDLDPDLIVLADYGLLVPPAILDMPRSGALNLHPSLLPRWRGASPVPATILAGDTEGGVTLMRMDAGLDSGPIVRQSRTPVGPSETAPELEARLASIAADLLRTNLGPWLRGELKVTPQPAGGVTHAPRLSREDGRLDSKSAVDQAARQVRALQPWPGTFIETDSGRLAIWRAEPIADPGGGPPGALVADGDGLRLILPGGALRLVEVQPAGGRRMSGAELRRGRPGLVGSRVRQATVG